MRRVAIAVTAAALVALAGCGGGGGSPTDVGGDGSPSTTAPTPTADATEGPTTPQNGASTATGTAAGTEPATPATTAPPTTARPLPAELPVADLAWVNESGIRFGSLVRSHATTVNNESSYTIRQTVRIAERNSANVSVRTVTLAASAGQRRALTTRTTRLVQGGERRVSRSVRYRTVEDGDDVIYSRTNGSGDVTYRTEENPSRSFDRFYDTATLSDLTVGFGAFAFEFDGATRVDGRVAYRFVSDSLAEGNHEAVPDDASDVSATMVVSERGVIRSLTYEYDSVNNDVPVRVTVTYEATALGETTVSEPDWLDEARSSGDDALVEAAPNARNIRSLCAHGERPGTMGKKSKAKKKRLAKLDRQNSRIPPWVMMKTDMEVQRNPQRRNWRRSDTDE